MLNRLKHTDLLLVPYLVWKDLSQFFVPESAREIWIRDEPHMVNIIRQPNGRVDRDLFVGFWSAYGGLSKLSLWYGRRAYAFTAEPVITISTAFEPDDALTVQEAEKCRVVIEPSGFANRGVPLVERVRNNFSALKYKCLAPG